jgi:hypothetical protein
MVESAALTSGSQFPHHCAIYQVLDVAKVLLYLVENV